MAESQCFCFILLLAVITSNSVASKGPPIWVLEKEFPFLGSYKKKTNVTDAEEDSYCNMARFAAFYNQMVRAIVKNDFERVKSIRNLIEKLAHESEEFAKSICYTSGDGPILECRRTSAMYLAYKDDDPKKQPSRSNSFQCKCWNSLNFRTIYDDNFQRCKADHGAPCNDVISECHLPGDTCVGVQNAVTGEYCTCQKVEEFRNSIVRPKGCAGRSLGDTNSNSRIVDTLTVIASVIFFVVPILLDLIMFSPTTLLPHLNEPAPC